jgi:hypothetical protein
VLLVTTRDGSEEALIVWPQPTRVSPVKLGDTVARICRILATATLGWLPVSEALMIMYHPARMAKVVVASGTVTATAVLTIEMVVELIRTNPPTSDKPRRRQPAAYRGVPSDFVESCSGSSERQ